MNVPKDIEKLITRRGQLADELNAVDCKITNWLAQNGVEFTEQASEFGCMLTTEPWAYAQMTLEAIERK